jgi:hypothetical protein
VHWMRNAQRLFRRVPDLYERHLHLGQESGRSRRLPRHLRLDRRVQSQEGTNLPGHHRLRGRAPVRRWLLLRQRLHWLLSGVQCLWSSRHLHDVGRQYGAAHRTPGMYRHGRLRWEVQWQPRLHVSPR